MGGEVPAEADRTDGSGHRGVRRSDVHKYLVILINFTINYVQYILLVKQGETRERERDGKQVGDVCKI
jgi:hypothetical protein